MADDLSLLLKIKGDSAGAIKAAADTRAAIAALRANAGAEFGAMQKAGTSALASIGDSMNVFISQRIPLVGGAFVRVTENLKGMGEATKKGEKELAALNKTINGLAQTTGKSSSQITTFLTNFIQLETQAKRDTAVIETFGAAAAQKLIPQLEKAGTELGTVALSSGQAASGFAGVLAAMGPVGIAAAGIAVEIVAVGIALGVVVKVGQSVVETFFGLAKSAADYRGKLFDLSQQTGVNVETLSALEFAARKTGSNLDSITSSLVLFQTKLEEAQDSTTKTGKLFDELNISTNNTEDAFRDALKALAAMPEGFHQTDQAAELFGRRGAKQILAILKETNGDLDALEKKLRAAGVLTTREAAQAADDFNDALLLLQLQFRALLGAEAIPAATKAIEALSKVIKENHILVDALGGVVKIFGLGIKGGFVDPIVLALNQLSPVLEDIAEKWERVAAAMQLVTGRGLTIDPNAIPALPIVGTGAVDVGGAAGVGGGVFRKSQKDARKAALDEAADEAAKELELQRKLMADLQFLRDKRGADIQNDFERQERLANDRLATLQKQIDKERGINQQALAVGGILQAEFDDKKRDLDLRATQAQNARDEEVKRLTLEKDRARLESNLTFLKQREAMDKAADEGKLARIKEAAERGSIAESTAIERQLEFLKAAHVTRLEIINTELNAEVTSKERKAELNTEKTISETRYTDEFKRLTKERIEALQAEGAVAPSGKLPQQGDVPISDKPPRPAGLGIDFNSTTEAFGLFGRAIEENLTGDRQTAALAGLDAMSLAFQSLGQAAGDAIYAFTLFGSAGIGLKKFTATMLAEVARMAAVQAVWELAQGFAMLAMNFFWPDPKLAASAAAHFHAAAIYGGIAVLAAGAGRLTAGGSFAESGGGGAGGTSGSRNPSDARNQGRPEAQDFNRRNFNTPQMMQPQINITVVGQATEGFRYMVEKVAVDSVRNNGPMRKIQQGEDV